MGTPWQSGEATRETHHQPRPACDSQCECESHYKWKETSFILSQARSVLTVTCQTGVEPLLWFLVDSTTVFFFLFNRSTIDLQCFTCTSKWFGLPWWLSWWRIRQQCGRPGSDPWVGKIPWRRERLPTPVFRPGEFRGLNSPWDHKESDTTKRLSLHFQSDSVTSL